MSRTRISKGSQQAGITFTIQITNPGTLKDWIEDTKGFDFGYTSPFGAVSFELFQCDWSSVDPAPILHVRMHVTVEGQLPSTHAAHATKHSTKSAEQIVNITRSGSTPVNLGNLLVR